MQNKTLPTEQQIKEAIAMMEKGYRQLMDLGCKPFVDVQLTTNGPGLNRTLYTTLSLYQPVDYDSKGEPQFRLTKKYGVSILDMEQLIINH